MISPIKSHVSASSQQAHRHPIMRRRLALSFGLRIQELRGHRISLPREELL